ncbi:MAG: hypothetical protein U0793_00850 [Gemmataceae bacterium]
MRSSLFATLLVLSPAIADAGETKVRCDVVEGALLAKETGGWRALSKGDAAPLGVPVVALPGAQLSGADGAVTVKLMADIGQRGPLPALEAGVVLHASKGLDLDVTLEEGIIVFDNGRKDGDAKVRVRVRGEQWDVTLRPESRVGFELYSRYAPGVLKEFGGKLEEPCAQVIGLVTRGSAFLKTEGEGYGLKAPPGYAIFQWDSLERKLAVNRLEKLPEFVRPMTEKEQAAFEECVAAAGKLNGADKKKALAGLIASDSHVARLTGVTAAGALGEAGIVLAGLEDAKHRDVRQPASLVLRHYVGRGSKQMEQVFHLLTGAEKATPAKASLFLELLLGFTAEQKLEPVTYEILIRLLDHPRLGARELAHWHLVRLAPLETPIPYDAAAPEAERKAAVQRWREMIPAGELPPHLREKK